MSRCLSHSLIVYQLFLGIVSASNRSLVSLALANKRVQSETSNVYNVIFCALSVLKYVLQKFWRWKIFNIALISVIQMEYAANVEEHAQKTANNNVAVSLAYIHLYDQYIMESSQRHRLKWNLLSNDILRSIKALVEKRNKTRELLGQYIASVDFPNGAIVFSADFAWTYFFFSNGNCSV